MAFVKIVGLKLPWRAVLQAFHSAHRSPLFLRALLEPLALDLVRDVGVAAQALRARLAGDLGFDPIWFSLTPLQRAVLAHCGLGSSPFPRAVSQASAKRSTRRLHHRLTCRGRCAGSRALSSRCALKAAQSPCWTTPDLAPGLPRVLLALRLTPVRGPAPLARWVSAFDRRARMGALPTVTALRNRRSVLYRSTPIPHHAIWLGAPEQEPNSASVRRFFGRSALPSSVSVTWVRPRTDPTNLGDPFIEQPPLSPRCHRLGAMDGFIDTAREQPVRPPLSVSPQTQAARADWASSVMSTRTGAPVLRCDLTARVGA
jgi:hypothetical protein